MPAGIRGLFGIAAIRRQGIPLAVSHIPGCSLGSAHNLGNTKARIDVVDSVGAFDGVGVFYEVDLPFRR